MSLVLRLGNKLLVDLDGHKLPGQIEFLEQSNHSRPIHQFTRVTVNRQFHSQNRYRRRKKPLSGRQTKHKIIILRGLCVNGQGRQRNQLSTESFNPQPQARLSLNAQTPAIPRQPVPKQPRRLLSGPESNSEA